MKLKSLWYSYHPEQRWYFIGVIIVAIICIVVGTLIGIRVLKPTDDIVPAGKITEKELEANATKASRSSTFKANYAAARPPEGSFWLGPAPKGQKLFTSKRNRDKQLVVAYFLTKTLTGAPPGFPYRGVITIPTDSRGIRTTRKTMSYLPDRATAVGVAYMDGSRATIPIPGANKIVTVTVAPDPEVNGTQPALIAALKQLERR